MEDTEDINEFGNLGPITCPACGGSNVTWREDLDGEVQCNDCWEIYR